MDEEEDENSANEDDHATFSLEDTTGISNMTTAQSRLATIFRPPFDLIKNLDLDQAKEYAESKQKWLLVNIQNVAEFQCQVLNRDLWTNPGVKTVIKENFVFVQVCF